jgi:hypothetical protein
MTAQSEHALAVLKRMARGHPGASSGELAAWDIVRNLEDDEPVEFIDCFVRLDAIGRVAVVQLLMDVAGGRTGRTELR